MLKNIDDVIKEMADAPAVNRRRRGKRNLRDMFAMHAMQALIPSLEGGIGELAFVAYEFADAMMEARVK